MGVGVGAVTGLFGSGGGFLIVPTLAIALAFTKRTAVGTSLAIVAATSMLGLVAQLVVGRAIDIDLTLAMTTGCVVAAIAGASIARSRASPTARPHAAGRRCPEASGQPTRRGHRRACAACGTGGLSARRASAGSTPRELWEGDVAGSGRGPTWTQYGPSTDPVAAQRAVASTARERKIPAVAGSSDEALCRTRTGDPFLTMEVLYQLS